MHGLVLLLLCPIINTNNSPRLCFCPSRYTRPLAQAFWAWEKICISQIHSSEIISNPFVIEVLNFCFLGVVPFKIWNISSWEKNYVVTSWANAWKDIYFTQDGWSCHFEWKLILSVTQLVTTVIFFSAWDKSHVKLGKSQNSIQKMRILGTC